MCRPLLCLCRPFMIFEGCLDSNPEYCRSKLARYRLSHPPSRMSCFPEVIRICDVLIRIRIRGSIPLDYGSGPYSFLQWLQYSIGWIFMLFCFVLTLGIFIASYLEFTSVLKIKGFLHFLLVDGRIHLNNYGSGSGRPKNLQILLCR